MDLKNEFARLLDKAINDKSLSLAQIESLITTPPTTELGDYAFPVFSLCKIYKKPAQEIAIDIVSQLKKISASNLEFSAVSGYVNAKANPHFIFEETIRDVIDNGKNYGKVRLDRKQYVLDTFQPNPLKMIHVGHIRNGVTGDSIYRLLTFANQDVKTVSFQGDIGTHIARWLWYYKSLPKTSQKPPERDISRWIGEIYISSGEKLKENPDLKKEVDDLQVKLMSDEKLKKELKKLVNLSNKDFLKVADELNVTIDKVIFESECEIVFNKIKEKLFNDYKDIFMESENAIVANLKDEQLGNLILVKQNGALLYGAKDSALVNIKKKLYPSCNNFLYVVASEQDFYLKQLFRLFELIYSETTHKHISFGLVSLESGKMKSRTGEVVFYEDLRDALFEKIGKILEDNDLEQSIEIIRDIATGVIKFEMLKISINKDFIFSMEKALDLQGDSAPYLQYSGVRAKSILKKAEFKPSLSLLNKENLLEEDELNLVKCISRFKEVVLSAATQYKPNLIASYSLDLAHLFSKFYSSCVVLHEDEHIRNNRLLLIKAYLITLENALWLLGIKIPEKM